MPSHDVIYQAHFSSSVKYSLSINYDSSKGNVTQYNYADPSNHEPYSAMTTVLLTASEVGSTFIGFFDESDNLIESQPLCNYVMPDHDVTIYAKFE